MKKKTENLHLVQTRVSSKTISKLERQALSEGTSVAMILRRLAEDHVLEHRTIYERVRSIELAMIGYGIVPKGSKLPVEKEER